MSFDDDKALAIRLVSSIIENTRILNSREKMLAALKQLIAVWKYIPPELRKKAAELFNKIWESKDIAISTDPELMKETTAEVFDDPKVDQLYCILSVADRTSLRLGQSMKKLRARWLEDEVARKKEELRSIYGKRGLSIGHMITTDDIQYFFDQCEKSFGPLDSKDYFFEKRKQILELFEWWALNYMSFTVLVEPDELESGMGTLNERILQTATNASTDFIVIHMISSFENTQKLLTILGKLKTDGRLNYLEMKPTINQIGALTALSLKLSLK